MNVGIFWVYDGQVFGALTPLSEAELGTPGMHDSPQNHVDAWPCVRSFLPQHLRDGEYFKSPEGGCYIRQLACRRSYIWM